jgi:AraC-like DNA-binding protein
MFERPMAHDLPGAFVLHLARLVTQKGKSEEALFQGLTVRPEELTDPWVTVPVPTAVAIAERARELTGEPGIGVYHGLQTYGPEHGYLGFAAMSAATLRESIDVVCTYSPIRSTAFALHLETGGPRAALVIAERADFGSARDIVMLSLLIGLWHATMVNLGRTRSETATIELMLPEPDYHHRFRSLLPEVQFGRPSHRLVFDAALLDEKLVTADPASFRLARDECDRALRSASESSRLVDQVARLALRAEGGSRSLKEVAEVLGLSPRTLRRHLTGHGTSFAAVRDGERQARAKILLAAGLSVSQVAAQLGYSTPGNFMRAFRHRPRRRPGSAGTS